VDSAGKRTLSRAHKRAALREIACVVVPAPATSARSGGRSAEQQPDALGVVDALVGAGFDIVQLRQARRAVAAHDGWARSEMAVKPAGRLRACVRAGWLVLAAAGPVWRRCGSRAAKRRRLQGFTANATSPPQASCIP
jgi:hypothetical protein